MFYLFVDIKLSYYYCQSNSVQLNLISEGVFITGTNKTNTSKINKNNKQNDFNTNSKQKILFFFNSTFCI